MDKKDIIELFLRNGVLLSPEEFETLDEKNYMHLLKKRLAEKKGSEIMVITPKTGKMSCEHFVKICSSKFELLREEILKKTEAVSINKGKKLFSEVTIIGRIKETTPKGFVLEDITGETEVACESNDIHVSDVLGLKGFFKENRFFPSQTIWPDIPLANSSHPSGPRITLAAKLKEGMSGIVVCPACPESEKSDNVITGFSRFAIIKISKPQARFTVIAYSPLNEISEDAAVRMLKKRMIPDENIIENLISEVPEILWIFNNKRNWAKNYRGVVIISTDNLSFAEYDGGEVIFGRADQ